MEEESDVRTLEGQVEQVNGRLELESVVIVNEELTLQWSI